MELEEKKVNSIKYWLYEELFGNWNKFEGLFVISLLLMQLFIYILNPDSGLGMLAGIFGVLCVTFVAKGKISNYIFGFIQIGITIFLGLQARLWGELLENSMYFIAQFVGWKNWEKNLKEDTHLVKTKKLDLAGWTISLGTVLLGSFILGSIFAFFNGSQPFADATTTVIAFVAQVLMIRRYREQWIFWFILNLVSIYVWNIEGNISMVAMYIAFTLINWYGYINWKKLQS